MSATPIKDLKTSPLPWVVEPYAYSIYGGKGNKFHICDMRGWGYLTGAGGLNLSGIKAEAIQKANAELIVRAVNNHEKLLEACKKAQEDINWMVNNKKFLNSDFDYLEQAIKQAEGGL